jgi:hypothetical protein
MRARDYVTLARQYYPSETAFDDPLFLQMLNDARNRILLLSGITTSVEYPLTNTDNTYHVPVHQTITGVYYYSKAFQKEFVLPRYYVKSVYDWKVSPVALSFISHGLPYGYFWDAMNNVVALLPEDGRFNPSDKLRISFVPFAEPFTSWDDNEIVLPEQIQLFVPIEYAIRIAMFDMQYGVADGLRNLLLYNLQRSARGG